LTEELIVCSTLDLICFLKIIGIVKSMTRIKRIIPRKIFMTIPVAFFITIIIIID